MNKRVLIPLSVIVLTSGVVGFFMLSRGHDWGDDFAVYIMQAQSIVSGRMNEFVYRSTFTVQESSLWLGPISYPWGFPLLLAPVYGIFGLNILSLKLVLTCCYLAFLIAFFLLARTRLTELESLLLTAVMAFNGNLLQAQNAILSDLPFLFFSTLGLWLVERYQSQNPDSPRSIRLGIAIALVIFLGAFTRPNGFLLLLPLAVTQFISVRQYLHHNGSPSRVVFYAAIPYLAFGLCYSLQALIFPSSGGRLGEEFLTTSAVTLFSNLRYYFWLPGDLFAGIISVGKMGYIALLLFFGLSLAARHKRDVPILLYGLATIGLYVTLPATQGVRYIYPIYPIFFLFAFQGMKMAAGWLRPRYRGAVLAFFYIFWAGLAVVSLSASLGEAENNISAGRNVSGGWESGPFSPASASMFAYIRQQTPADSIIIFFKPRAMRLLTNRDSIATPHCADLPKGNYLVLVNDNARKDQISPQEISHCNPAVQAEPVFHQQGFLVYRIQPAPKTEAEEFRAIP